MPALRGVYHLAGVFDDAVVTQLTWEQFENVFAPKVRGTWNLHALTRDRTLDVFSIFASAASFLAPTGLANYAAANAFQDALALHRRSLGLPAASIDWGPWARTGRTAAVGLEREAQWRRGGFDTMPIEAALQALETISTSELAHVAVLPVDWHAFAASLVDGTAPPLYKRVLAAPPPRTHGELHVADRRNRSSAEPSLDRASLLKLNDHDRRHSLETFLRSEAAAELGMPAADLDLDRPLSDEGFDSLMAVQLKNRLQSSLGVSAPVSLFVAGRSVKELAREVEALLEEEPTTELHADPLSNPEELLANIDDLSDQQIDELLNDALLVEEVES